MVRWVTALPLLLAALCPARPAASRPAEPAPPVPLVEKPRVLEMPAEYPFLDNARDAAFSPDGRTLVFSDPRHSLIVWDVVGWKESKRLPPGSARYDGSQSFSGDGKVLAVRTEKQSLRLLDATTWRVLKETDVQQGPKAVGGPLRLSHDGKRVAAALDVSGDNRMLLWDVEKGTTKVLEGHTTRLRGYAVSPDGRLVASGSGEEGSLRRPERYPAELKFWDAATGKEIFSGSGTQGMIYRVVFSPDSKLIALLADDGTVRVWDVVLRRELFALKDDTYLHAAVFSPDGKWILTAGFHSEIQAWDAATGRLEKTIDGGIRIVTSASFSPDGRMALLTSNDHKPMRLLMLTVPEK
jgi:WD40 repeat protein